MKLPYGKIPVEILREIVFKNLGVNRKEVVVGPSEGIDGSVINVGNYSLIVSTDPITGALERIGLLAVNVNANDVATFGVEPAFLLSCILLPEGAERKIVQSICTQMNKAAKDLGITIVGGHCEVTPGLANPVVVGCVIGVTDKAKYVTAAGAKAGDKLILTKSAGIEGTAILASDREARLKNVLTPKMLRNAKGLFDQISIVKEAIVAFRSGGVTAMHDPTEGGVAGGIHEMANASNVGVKILEEEIRVLPETSHICKHFKIDPLALISSGALLISSKPDFAEKIVKVLEEENVSARIIGEFLENPEIRILVDKNGKSKSLKRPMSDHLWRVLTQK